MSTPLHLKLRESCSALHELIESSYPFDRLTSPDISGSELSYILKNLNNAHSSLQRYLTASLKIHPLYKFIDQACRLKQLNFDLNSLGAESHPSEVAVDLPNSVFFATGVLYVLMGSTLGGAFISKSLSMSNDAQVRKAVNFFVGDADSRGKNWREFLAAMNESVLTADEEKSTIDGARYTFMLIQQQFMRLE